MTNQIPHFIDGKRSTLSSTRTADVLNPSTGEVAAQVLLASAADVDAAVASAVEAQKGWAAWNPQRRARVLMKFIELVNTNADELAELLSIEHGKTVADSLGDIQRGIEVIEFAVGIPHLMKGEFTEGAGAGIDVYSIRQPLGVVAGITPFNFPAMIPLWKAGPALACGNAIILKPSERDPSVPLRLAELFIEAGLPPGVLQVVQGDKEAVDAILEHPDIKAVGFVGSSDIAQYIYATSAANGKRSQCFGGAKNHMVILPDADLEACVPRFALVEPTTTIAEALLDQRICCGVGNVFKSEICWAARLDPFTPVDAVPVSLRRELVQIAAQQLRANLDTARRTTVPGGVAVYGHAGERCRRCGASIRMRRHGVHARSTYWCPGCQVPPSPPDTVEVGQAIDQ